MRKILLLILMGLAVFAVSCGQMRLPFLANVNVDAKFTRFPVDLNRLFYDDDPAYYNNALQDLTTGVMFISPFSRHVSGHHPEGYGKMVSTLLGPRDRCLYAGPGRIEEEQMDFG